jgi:alpha-L-fucosidase
MGAKYDYAPSLVLRNQIRCERIGSLFMDILPGPFNASWDSLRQFECPQWFADAKLGIWSHWGPQSVPMFGDWYARNLYIEGNEQYRHHLRVYGHPSKTGYKDLLPLWKAEKFEPQALMKRFVRAGAKYFFGQAMHHDNFDNYDSSHNRWNSVNIGPKCDIVARWREAAAEYGLPFCLSEHLGASFNWFAVTKGADAKGPYAGIAYDGAAPQHSDLYHDNGTHYTLHGQDCFGEKWFTDNRDFAEHWFLRLKDLIDKYQPDGLYTDGGLPFGEIGLSIVAHLYNTSAKRNGGVNRAIYTQKDTDPAIYSIGVLDIERGQIDRPAKDPWQTDTSFGDWFYNVKDVYKTPHEIVETLVEIVSKNGNLLINVPQRPDGAIDEECGYILDQMALWVAANGEGIFGSRPWSTASEGSANSKSGAFNEARVNWTSDDFRFTAKGDTVYAYQMAPSELGVAQIRSLGKGIGRTVARVRKLGAGPVPFTQTTAGLSVTMASPSAFGPQGIAVDFE